ncbi:MAG: rRNA pseudouridine synthase [Candidatus Aenigmarchaeota archaeon]|nr:rRNA pseudouridine synthase [Candidatus Aenigmarchaeota archaeon]
MEERIQKLIARAGICSRRKAEELIMARKVRVNGKVAELGQKADPKTDRITVSGRTLRLEKKLYFLLYKPKGYVTTMSDEFGRPCVKDLLKEKGIRERIFSVGRLDYDSEGLIILTNDGALSNRITHPSFEVKKTYRVVLGKPLKEKDQRKIRMGVEVEGKTVEVSGINVHENPKVFEITIHEGRNRIIRKMMEALNYKILRLIRVKIGEINLTGIKEGDLKETTREEIELGIKSKEEGKKQVRRSRPAPGRENKDDFRSQGMARRPYRSRR